MRLFRIVLIFVTVLLVISCKKREAVSWDADYSVPVGKASLSINDLLPDSVLELNPDNSLNLVYNYNLLRFGIDSLLEIPDTTLADAYVLPFPFPVTANPGQTFISNSSVTRYDLDGAQLKEVEMKTGRVNYTIQNPLPEKVICEFSIPGALNASGQPFLEKIVAVAAVGGVPSISSGSFSIAGYNVDLRGPYGDEHNILVSNTAFKIADDGSPTVVTNQDTLYFTYSFDDIRPQYMFGYFGDFSQNIGPEETAITFFDQITAGSIDIDEVSVSLDIKNGIGADLRTNIGSLYAKDNPLSAAVDLTHTIVGSTQNINRAFRSGTTITPSVQTHVLDKTNSNIDVILEMLPGVLGYEAFFQINPFGNVSGNNDFAHADHPLEINMNIELPLRIIANNLTLEREFDIQVNGAERFNSARIYIDAVNTFPFSAELWVYLLDNQGQIADSVLASGMVNSGILDVNLEVQTAGLSKLEVPLNKSQIEWLEANKKIRVKAVFNTANQTQHQAIYSHYRLNLDIRADFNYTLQLR